MEKCRSIRGNCFRISCKISVTEKKYQGILRWNYTKGVPAINFCRFFHKGFQDVSKEVGWKLLEKCFESSIWVFLLWRSFKGFFMEFLKKIFLRTSPEFSSGDFSMSSIFRGISQKVPLEVFSTHSSSSFWRFPSGDSFRGSRWGFLQVFPLGLLQEFFRGLSGCPTVPTRNSSWSSFCRLLQVVALFEDSLRGSRWRFF